MRLVDRQLSAPGYVELAIGVLAEGQRYVAGTGRAGGNSLFRIASISKVFTSLALAAAVERREIDLTAPAGQYLPGFTLPTWNGQQILVEHLASHSSGLRDDHDPGDDGTRAGFAASLASQQLASRPGEHWAYCNTGASLLANLLSMRAGVEFGELVADRVCRPLGLTDTVLALDLEQVSRLRPGHDAAGRPTATPTLPLHAGSGGFYSTVDDLLRLLAAHLDPAPCPEVRLVQQRRLVREDGAAGVGLGWLLDPLPATGAVATWHNGALPGYRSYVGFVAGTGCAVVVLTNTTCPVDELARTVLDELVAGTGAAVSKGERKARVVETRRRLASEGPPWTRGRERDFETVTMPERDCDLLRDLLVSERAETVVEVGLAYGSSALAIGEALVTVARPDPRHVIIDPFQESDWSNVGWDLVRAAGLDSIARLMLDPSSIALCQLVTEGLVADAAFVDGSHRFHEVFVDLYFLRTIVRPGGLIVVDDHAVPTVRTAARYFEQNLGWTAIPDVLSGGSLRDVGDESVPRCMAFRLPDSVDEPSFQAFRPF